MRDRQPTRGLEVFQDLRAAANRQKLLRIHRLRTAAERSWTERFSSRQSRSAAKANEALVLRKVRCFFGRIDLDSHALALL